MVAFSVLGLAAGIFGWRRFVTGDYHVIAGCSSCQVWVTGPYGENLSCSASLVGGDEDKDLAVLKIDGNPYSISSLTQRTARLLGIAKPRPSMVS